MPVRAQNAFKAVFNWVKEATTDILTAFARSGALVLASSQNGVDSATVSRGRLNRGLAGKSPSVHCRAPLSSRSSDGRDATHAVSTSETARCYASEAGSRLHQSPR